ncbi:MAG: M10 family metallopeptidase C-terminal domain-containing protein [Ignavibacteriales bacterium]
MAIYNGTSLADLIKGSALADIIYGNGGDDSLYGLGGNDTIYGGAGNDYLSGGDGNDILVPGSGVNDLRGGAGYDTFVMSARTTTSGFSDDLIYDMTDGDKIDVSAWGISDFSQIKAVMGVDYYGAAINAYYNGQNHLLSFLDVAPWQFEATDFIYSNAAGGTQNGTAYGDMLFGSRGDDVLNGNGGCDTLLGGIGNDTINGGAGGDDIYGGAGKDTMTGGTGYDAFIFQTATDSLYGSSHDVITDFVSGVDWIDLCGVDANSGVSGNQAFSFIGTANFSAAGQLRYVSANGVTMIYGNTDADSTPEFQIELTGAHTLHAYDFVL